MKACCSVPILKDLLEYQLKVGHLLKTNKQNHKNNVVFVAFVFSSRERKKHILLQGTGMSKQKSLSVGFFNILKKRITQKKSDKNKHFQEKNSHNLFADLPSSI